MGIMVTLEVIIGAIIVIAAAIYAWFRKKPPVIVIPKPYMKLNPPADVDKAGVANPPISNDNSCWMATAANMLAAAGYGSGATLQARANDIYNDLITWQGGVANGGWIDTALSWWLGSTNNTWTTNPYTVVTVYGNKSPKYPWNNSNGAMFIANELRRCQFVGLSISWPIAGAQIGSGGHAITCWGDNGTTGTQTANPTNVRVTDSDTDTGGDVQNYVYDAFTNPNPGGANEGNGWYFNYDNNHPYIKHIVTLCPTQNPAGTQLVQKVTGSMKIHQGNKLNAVDLHYKVGTDTTILSYKTTIDWTSDAPPTIKEETPRTALHVDWFFKKKPIPYCTTITIDTEFILPYYNAIWYKDVHFTYPEAQPLHLPEIGWQILTPEVREAERIKDVSGGYVVGGFDITPIDGEMKTIQYRFLHEYSFKQNPEQHTLVFSGSKGYKISNIMVGHSYGYLSKEQLWEYKDWMTATDESYELSEEKTEVKIDWDGKLPYPEGEDITGRIREKKGPGPTYSVTR